MVPQALPTGRNAKPLKNGPFVGSLKFSQVEVKTRRVGGTTYPVPVPIAANRQFSLALRWTTQFAGARHGMGMPAAVAAEIIDAFQGQGNVIKKRDDVHKMAQANKAFAHYAWGN